MYRKAFIEVLAETHSGRMPDKRKLRFISVIETGVEPPPVWKIRDRNGTLPYKGKHLFIGKIP
jgi:hypothetical protein